MARNNFDFGRAGLDIDLRGATIHGYNRDWVGVPGATGDQPGRSVAYSQGDLVYHANSLWYAMAASDNIEPGTPAANNIWVEITSGGGAGISMWDMAATYPTGSVVIYNDNTGLVLYVWVGTANATGGNEPGTDANWRLIGEPPAHEAISSGIGIRLDAHAGSIRVSLAPNVNQNMTFDQNVTVQEDLHATGDVTSGNTISAPIGSIGQVNAVEVNSRTTSTIGTTSTARIEVAESSVFPRAREGHEAVTLDQLDEAENRIITRAREEFEIEPEPVVNHEFNYYRTFENTDDNIFDPDATMIPVTLPIGTQISQFPEDHAEHPNEVNIVYPTEGPGAGARSSTGRRLSGTLYTSPTRQSVTPGGITGEFNTTARGDEGLIGTTYADYFPPTDPSIFQALARHNEMFMTADFEIILRYRLQGDPGNTVTLRETWPNTRLNFECWNHNILFHHRNLPGVTNGGDDRITAGPLLNYFAGAIGLPRTVGTVTTVETAPGDGTYQDGDRYLGDYIPGSYISIAPNVTLNSSGNNDALTERLQTNQTARSWGLFASTDPNQIHPNTNTGQHNADMRPAIYTAMPCPWKLISDAIRHNYINGGTATDSLPASTVSEISNSNIFHFTRAEHRGFQETGERHVEPIDTTVTDAFAPLIPEVFIEVGSNYGEVLEMELEFNMDNVQYRREVIRGVGQPTRVENACGVIPRGWYNPFTENGNNPWERTEGQFTTTLPIDGPIQDWRPNFASLPPAKWINLDSSLNQGSSISANPYFVQNINNLSGGNYGFLYGGNSNFAMQRRFRSEEAITSNARQLYSESWAADDYAIACGTFSPDLMTFNTDNFEPGTSRDPRTGPPRRVSIDTYAVFSRPDEYTPAIGTGELFTGITLQGINTATHPIKFGQVPDHWDSRRAFGAEAEPYSAGDIVLSMGALPRANSQEPLITDESRLRYWIATRNPRLEPNPNAASPGQRAMRVVEADRQGPAHLFSEIGVNVGGYDSLWIPLAWNRVRANNDTGVFAPLNEQVDVQKTDPIYPMFTPGNYTVGHGPEYPSAFEDYEITGLPVVINKNAISNFANRGNVTPEGNWTLRSTLADRTHTSGGLLGRFNPSVFHFRKSDDSSNDDSFIDFAFDPERAGTPADSGASQYVFQIAPGGRGTPPLTGYLDPYENLVVDSFRVASNNGTDASLPNTRVAGRMNTTQNPFRDWDSTNAILHCIPQSNIRPTGTLDRTGDNGQEIYMPQLAVLTDGSRDADGNLIYTWKCESNTYQAAGNAPLDESSVATGTPVPLTPFGWQDHNDYLRINFQSVLDDGNPDPSSSASETLYNIIGWTPGDGRFRVVRVAYDSDANPSPATNEPAWQPDASTVTAPTFFNISQYRNGTRHGVDFLVAGSNPETRVAGEVEVHGRDGVRITTSAPLPWDTNNSYRTNDFVSYNNGFYRALVDIATGGETPDIATHGNPPTRSWETLDPDNYNQNQLFVNIDDDAFQVGPPNDPLESETDTGNPLPFGMFGLIDLFLGQQFSNTEAGAEQTVPDTAFDYFERYRRRGTSYYWFPNRAVVVGEDGNPDFIDRAVLFPPDGNGPRQTDLRLKTPTVFRDVVASTTPATPVPRSVAVTRPSRGQYFSGATGTLRLRWSSAGDRPDLVDGRYYVLYGEDANGNQVQLLFTSNSVTVDGNTDWLVFNGAEVFAPGPNNAYTTGGAEFFGGSSDIRLFHFPLDDYRVFEGIWQNYPQINDPIPANGEWRAVLEG